MKNSTIIKILYWVYIILLIGMIFRNSFANQDASAKQSTAVLETVNKALESVGVEFRFEHYIIRKMGHVIEFLTLGASLFLGLVLYDRVSVPCMVYCSFASGLIALTDETIQYFVGRGSMVLDVWLDFASSLLGIVLAYSIFYLVSLRKNKTK